VATYRLYTCVDLSQQPPAAERGHTWQEVELRGRTGWVDTSVALGVWEPYTPKRRERDEEKSRRKPQAAAQSLTTARWVSRLARLENFEALQHWAASFGPVLKCTMACRQLRFARGSM
jgi:hypothetical protein